jgi:putative membrane protein
MNEELSINEEIPRQNPEKEVRPINDTLNCLQFILLLFKNLNQIANHVFVPKWKTIKNNGSLARDLLAAERTFLVWLKMGLNLMIIGLAIVKFIASKNHKTFTLVAGTVLISIGIFCVLYAWVKNMAKTKLIEVKLFNIDTIGINLFVIVGIVVGILSMILIFL